MPSTPTVSLRLEKQATGEQLNQWGERLNTVIDLTEQAIAGTLVKPLSGNTTLTVTNYAADEARNATLIFTAGPGLVASPTVTVPQAPKQWFVINRTGFPVVMTSGGTNVSIPNGRQGIVACDGVDLSLFEPVSEAVAMASAASAASAAQAATSAQTAMTSASTATLRRDQAETARDEARAARDVAVGARDAALGYRNGASGQADRAKTEADRAAASASSVDGPAIAARIDAVEATARQNAIRAAAYSLAFGGF